MRRWICTLLSVSLALVMVGCEGNPKPRPKGRAGRQKTVPPATPDRQGQPAQSAAASAAPETPSAPMPPAAAPAAATPIRLSTGVALPQTGLDGTLMSFSVDYEFTEGQPDLGGYVWVIERARGASIKQKAQLSNRGNLTALAPGWRPEDGPFKSHIEDLKGGRRSESIEMQ
jgi:hypothetical protein